MIVSCKRGLLIYYNVNYIRRKEKIFQQLTVRANAKIDPLGAKNAILALNGKIVIFVLLSVNATD